MYRNLLSILTKTMFLLKDVNDRISHVVLKYYCFIVKKVGESTK